jgi:hypothetical protein
LIKTTWHTRGAHRIKKEKPGKLVLHSGDINMQRSPGILVLLSGRYRKDPGKLVLLSGIVTTEIQGKMAIKPEIANISV